LAYSAYVLNATQFLLKLRAARRELPTAERPSQATYTPRPAGAPGLGA
jgi:hypothetical protein